MSTINDISAELNSLTQQINKLSDKVDIAKKDLLDLVRLETEIDKVLVRVSDLKTSVQSLKDKYLANSKIVFQHKLGDIDTLKWSAALNNLDVNDKTNRRQSDKFNIGNGVDVTVGRFLFGHKFEVPSLLENGLLDFNTYIEQHNAHNMLHISGNDHNAFYSQHLAYLQHSKRFRIKFDLLLKDPLSNYSKVPWFVVFQLHPGSFGRDFGTNLQPPIAIYMIDGKWHLSARGSVDGNGYTHEVNSPRIPIDSINKFIVEWVQDYSGDKSYTFSSINGNVFDTTSPNAVPVSALNTLAESIPASHMTIGNYHGGPVTNTPCITIGNVKLELLD